MLGGRELDLSVYLLFKRVTRDVATWLPAMVRSNPAPSLDMRGILLCTVAANMKAAFCW